MIDPSAAYKAAIQQNMRGSMEFAATVGIEDLAFRDAAVLTDNGHLPFSDLQTTKTAIRTARVNATAETNMYLLDGTHQLLPDEPEYQGFVSEAVSDETGEFATPVVITISAGLFAFDLAGLTLEFDSINNDYPTDFDLTFSFMSQDSETIVAYEAATDNRQTRYVTETRADGINTIRISFTKTHNVNRRLRLFRVIFGVARTFTGGGVDGIISMSHKTRIHPLMTENTQIELNFVKADPDKDYNPENLSGIWKYLTKGQEVHWDYFFNISETQREHIPGGKFYLKNAPTTKAETVQFAATGLVQTLTMVYTRGLYYPAGRTYYDLFTDLLTFANLPLDAEGEPIWRLDGRLAQYKCYLPLPRDTVAALLQILCQNTGSICVEDTNGYLHVTLPEQEISDNSLTLTTARQYPGYTPQLPPLRDIIYAFHSVSVEATVSELHRKSVHVDGTVVLPILYGASTAQSASITGGTLVSAEFFAYGCMLTVNANNATIDVVVTGKPLIFSSSQRVYHINPQGEDAPVEMALLSDETLCDAIAKIWAKYLQEPKRYMFSYMGDPARRANDIFRIDTRFAENIPAQVIASEYSFNAGSNGVLELKNFE